MSQDTGLVPDPWINRPETEFGLFHQYTVHLHSHIYKCHLLGPGKHTPTTMLLSRSLPSMLRPIWSKLLYLCCIRPKAVLPIFIIFSGKVSTFLPFCQQWFCWNLSVEVNLVDSVSFTLCDPSLVWIPIGINNVDFIHGMMDLFLPYLYIYTES